MGNSGRQTEGIELPFLYISVHSCTYSHTVPACHSPPLSLAANDADFLTTGTVQSRYIALDYFCIIKNKYRSFQSTATK